MSVTVHLSPDTAHQFEVGDSELTEATEISQAANELGIVLRPQHPGTSDPILEALYTVDVEGRVQGEQVAARLRTCNGVEAAYFKPADELPW